MNGRQLADAARRLRPDLKVLFTTGYARNAIVHDGRLDPGVVLIPKPFTYAAVAAKLADLLDDADGLRPASCWSRTRCWSRMVAADQLEDLGYRVETAGSATEAMNKVKLMEGDIALAIVDIGLPDIKGDVLVGRAARAPSRSADHRGERLRRPGAPRTLRRRRARQLHPQALHAGRSQARPAAAARRAEECSSARHNPLQKNSSPH